jgi:cation transport ATPase
MGYLYRSDSQARTQRFRGGDLVLGLMCLAGAGAFIWRWPVYGTVPGTWSFASAAVLAFVAFGAFLNGISPEKARDSAQ